MNGNKYVSGIRVKINIKKFFGKKIFKVRECSKYIMLMFKVLVIFAFLNAAQACQPICP